MSKFLGIALSYDENTRVLRADVKLYGMVAQLPAEVISFSRVENITIMRGPALTPNDVTAITNITAQALAGANVMALEWLQAAQVKDKADLLPDVPPVVPTPDPPAIPAPPNEEGATPV